MWISIGKLEFKKGLTYYFMLYLFFLFWSIFTLFGFFLYSNLNFLYQTYFQRLGISIIFYPKESLNLTEIEKTFQKLEYLQSVKIYSPEEVFNKFAKEIPENFLSQDEIKNLFPYLIEVKLKSTQHLSQLKKDLQLLKEISKIDFEIPLEQGVKNLAFLNYAHYGLILFMFLWNVFYLLFFFFLNKGLNNHLKEQIEVFQLLGGHVFRLKIIRTMLITMPLILIFLFSFLFYYYLSQNILYFFPFLKVFPDFKNLFELFFFLIYFLFLIMLYPGFIVFATFKKQ